MSHIFFFLPQQIFLWLAWFWCATLTSMRNMFFINTTFLCALWWPFLAKFSLNRRRNFKPHLNRRRNFKPHLNFIFDMKIKSVFTFQIDIRNQIHLYFYLHIVFHLLFQEYYILGCSNWLVILLIRFNLIKILLFWNGNSKSSGSNGPSWSIPAIVFCRMNTNGNPSSAFAI